MNPSTVSLWKHNKKFSFLQGVGLTAAIAGTAHYMAQLPLLGTLGQLVLAIILGMAWRAFAGVPRPAAAGIAFSSKTLLRIGIIMLGMRLNLLDIVHAGPKVFALAVINVAVTIPVVYGIARRMKVGGRLALLTACGTAICGAAAVVAVSPQIKAREEETAIGAAVVAILGTLFTLLYTALIPVLGLTQQGYGLFAGATLHEIAHAIAAAGPAGEAAVDMAVIVKLSRVALLVPVALLLGMATARRGSFTAAAAAGRTSSPDAAAAKPRAGRSSVPVPWFIAGFLAAAAVHTTGVVPPAFADGIVQLAYLLIAMAMAGLGLNVDIAIFRKLGLRPFAAGLLGSLLLSTLGMSLIHLFGLSV